MSEAKAATESPALPEPDITDLNRPHWEGLKDGVLKFQRCGACGHAWLPAREDCPNCLHHGAEWEAAGGKGRLISWVVYHAAFNAAFKDKLPYNVAVVELVEGPRVITNIVNPDDGMRGDAPVALKVEHEDGVALARFRLV